MSELKIFEIRYNTQTEKEWVAAHTNIEALKEYCSITSADLIDFDKSDEIVELPKDQWSKYTIRESLYSGASDVKKITFEEWMVGKTSPDIIAGKMYL